MNKLIRNQKGFGHHIILPILVIAVIALVGVHIMHASHASSVVNLGVAKNYTRTKSGLTANVVTPKPNAHIAGAIITPSQSLLPIPNFTGICAGGIYDNSSNCNNNALASINNARSALEGLPPLSINLSAYESLPAADQTFVITNLERISRGLAPATALTNQLNLSAQNGANTDTDPIIFGNTLNGGATIEGYGSNWASFSSNPLGSDYYWMYDDGYPSGNVGCPTSSSSGCWAHRYNILGTYFQCAGGALYMGAAESSNGASANVIVGVCGPPPTDVVFTWAQAEQILSVSPAAWSGYQSLGGSLGTGLGASSWAANRLDIFAAGGYNQIFHKAWDGNSWSGWQALNGFTTFAPAAVSWGPNRIDLFYTGTNKEIYHIAWNGSAWSGAQAMGVYSISSPTVASWGSNRLDLFYTGTDHHIYHMDWDGSTWSGTQYLGGSSNYGPAAVSWGPNRIDLFYTGTNNAVYHIAWNGSAWSSQPQSLAGVVKSGPAVSSWGSNRLDLFVTGSNNQIYHKDWDGSAWSSNWQDLGGLTTKPPAAVSWGPNRIDLFYTGTDNNVYHADY